MAARGKQNAQTEHRCTMVYKIQFGWYSFKLPIGRNQQNHERVKQVPLRTPRWRRPRRLIRAMNVLNRD